MYQYTFLMRGGGALTYWVDQDKHDHVQFLLKHCWDSTKVLHLDDGYVVVAEIAGVAFKPPNPLDPVT